MKDTSAVLDWGTRVKRLNKAHSDIILGVQISICVQQLDVISSVIILVPNCSKVYMVALKYRQYVT